MRNRRPAAYLALFGAAVIGWWVAVATVPVVRRVFSPAADPWVLTSYLLPDVVLLVAGSLLAAVAVLTGHRWSVAAVASVLGAELYATLHLLAWTGRTGQGWPGVALMAAGAAGTLLALVAVRRDGPP